MPFLALLAGLALAPADTVRLVVVATTDLHGQVTDWDYLRNASAAGGLARAATVIDSLRQRYPGQVIVVDAGNALAGNPLTAYYGREASRDPHPVVEAMNLVGYDVATPGDRDFDFGVDRFDRAVAGATFQWVSANLQVVPADTLAFAPYVVIQRNGVRIAIAGVTTPAAMAWNWSRLRGRLRVNRDRGRGRSYAPRHARERRPGNRPVAQRTGGRLRLRHDRHRRGECRRDVGRREPETRSGRSRSHRPGDRGFGDKRGALRAAPAGGWQVSRWCISTWCPADAASFPFG